MRRSGPRRDQLLLRLGAAKKEAGGAARFVQVQVPPEGQLVTRQSFHFRVDKLELQKAEAQDGHYLLRSDCRASLLQRIPAPSADGRRSGSDSPPSARWTIANRIRLPDPSHSRAGGRRRSHLRNTRSMSSGPNRSQVSCNFLGSAQERKPLSSVSKARPCFPN